VNVRKRIGSHAYKSLLIVIGLRTVDKKEDSCTQSKVSLSLKVIGLRTVDKKEDNCTQSKVSPSQIHVVNLILFYFFK
jgi:hypothetical protein